MKLALFLLFLLCLPLWAQEPAPPATLPAQTIEQLRAENAHLKQQAAQLATLLDWYKPQLWSCIDREVLLAKPRPSH